MNNDEHKETTIQNTEMIKQLKVIASDHEKRIRWVEKVAFYICGALLAYKYAWDFYKATQGGH